MTDLVVVVPGIMGSALHKDGKPAWDPTAQGLAKALGSRGRSLTDLTLPPGLRDEAPDDGVVATHLIPDVAVIPGLWTPIRGYTSLVDTLRLLGFTVEDGNLLQLPYDWRTSIRHIVRAATPQIEQALHRWRTTDEANNDAQIVFVAHSMGGLVARWYAVENPDLVRKVITIGTPSRGAMKPLSVLTKGIGPDWGWLQDRVRAFAASLPGLHQLLPAYPCVANSNQLEEFGFLKDHAIIGVDSSKAAWGNAFLNELVEREASDPAAVTRLHMLVGWGQTTLSTVRVSHGRPTFKTTYGDLLVHGDGTVPHVGAVPKGLPLDSNLVHGFPELHGNLQANAEVLAEVARILTDAPPIVLRGESEALSVDMPDLVRTGDDVTVSVELPPRARHAVSITFGEGRNAVERRPNIADGVASTTFASPAPGVHKVVVGGVGHGAPYGRVTGTVVVWDLEDSD